MDRDLASVSSEVFDRSKPRHLPGWAVQATYARNENGDPVCVEYRVRALRGSTSSERLRSFGLAIEEMERGTFASLEGEGAFPVAGIPRYVFEAASQGKLLEKGRAMLARNEEKRNALSVEARAILAPPAHRPGRPPVRSMPEKLRILSAVEVANRAGANLEEVATTFHMSRSALRDLLSWARNDATPRLFEASGQGRRGGGMTNEARQMLAEIGDN